MVRDFVNTREPQTGTEALQHPEDLRRWLDAHLPGTRAAALGNGDLVLARGLREGLRAVLLAHAGHDAPATALSDLDAALARVPVRVHVGPEGTRLLPGDDSPLALALAPLVDAVRACGHDGCWQRLKACSRETCRWAYYDGSRNQSRRWCSMAGCGNYVKMRRRNAGPTDQGPARPSPGAGDSPTRAGHPETST
nr:CGNR zinc finger domain-containing protein [Kineococcus vitellinus]